VHSGRRWIFFALNILGVVSASAAASVLPPIDGSLSGDFIPFGSTKMGIHWTATLATSEAGDQTVSLVFAGPGLKARAESVKTAGGTGTWRIPQAEVDLSSWFETVATRFFPGVLGFQAAGTVSLRGNGGIAPSGYAGSLQFELSGGSLSDAAGDWTFSELAGRLECPDFPAWTSATPQRLVFGELKVGETSLKKGVIDYQVESANRIRILGIHGEILGARIACGEFVIDSTNSPIETKVWVEALDLAALRTYLPNAVAEAHGTINAEIQVRWSVEEGFEFGHGTLQLRPEANASIRLAPSPGLLSSQVPARISLAPAWLRKMGRSFSQAFPAHQTLEAIENGEQPLMVESIEGGIDLGGQGKEALVVLHIVAHPAKTDAVKKVRLNVKVAGPLSDVLRYGMDQHLSFGP